MGAIWHMSAPSVVSHERPPMNILLRKSVRAKAKGTRTRSGRGTAGISVLIWKDANMEWQIKNAVQRKED